jgi:subtilisin family serine protease
MKNPLIPGADIHAEAAWDIFRGNPNSIIAIIDNGVDITHNDLAAKINGGDIGFLITTLPGTTTEISHGSIEAGIAAAVTNNTNNNGIAGVDWNAKIHPRNVFGNNSGDAGKVQGIKSALNFSSNVWTFNYSWDLTNDNNSPGRYSTTVRAAFADVYRNNRVSCVAMGNHQENFPDVAGFPANINSGIIAVGATNIFDWVSDFSVRGAHIDVSAPGDDIISTNFNNGYISTAGTSNATAHVAGLASLLKD